MFRNRKEAGKKLAKRLKKYSGVVVYAVPRGGVVLGVEIAKKLSSPLGLVIVRKIGHPDSLEYAVGVVNESGGITGKGIELASLDKDWLKKEIIKAEREIRRRKKKYLSFGSQPEVKGKTVILVDDGVATGLTFLAAIKELRDQGAKKIVAALPVVSERALKKIKKKVEEVVVLEGELCMGAVGACYEKFEQVEDDEVVDLLVQMKKSG